jgi:hypothetical protein
VRFSNLHEKRAEVIAELYKRLVEAFWDGERFVRGHSTGYAWEYDFPHGRRWKDPLGYTGSLRALCVHP